MWLWMILGLLTVSVLVACAARWCAGPRRTNAHPDALRVLDQRLVRGEITAEEYLRVRQLLTAAPS